MDMSFNNEKIEKYSSILADEYKELLIKETILRSENDNDVSVRVLLDIDTEAKRTIVTTSSKMEKRRKLIAILYEKIWCLVRRRWNCFTNIVSG